MFTIIKDFYVDHDASLIFDEMGAVKLFTSYNDARLYCEEQGFNIYAIFKMEKAKDPDHFIDVEISA